MRWPSWKGLLCLLSLGLAGARDPAPVTVVVDEQGRHYAGEGAAEPDRAGFVGIASPFVLGEDASRRLRMWPISWADPVDRIHVKAARYWRAGPEISRVYHEHLQRLRAAS